MLTCPRCRRSLSGDYTWCPYDGERLAGSAEEPVNQASGPPALLPHERASLAGLFERFEVKGRLGKGGMATVYHAVERSAGMDVAIKVMSHVLARTSPERQRFLREAELMLPIRHPNIMHVYALGELKDGSPYIVMQYLDGESLGAVMRRGDPFELPVALRIAEEAASGLAVAHVEGIVHRDVKPDNIFLMGGLAKLRGVKMLDFGLARLYGASGLTASGMIVGTPEYMAPEQAVNEPVDARTDIYALGVVLYRMVTGSLPFNAKGQLDYLAAHLALKPPPMQGRGFEVPEELQRIVTGAMCKLPRNRYPSMPDLREDLSRLRAGRLSEVTGAPTLWEDVYEPQSELAKNIARILRKKVGLPA